jgi:hypothetical protein
MKRIFFSITVVIFCIGLVGFGGAGGCGGGAEVTTIGASLLLPNAIRDLTGYQVSLVLEDKLANAAIFGPQLMTLNPNNNRWEVDVEGIEDGDYIGTIDIVVSTATGDVPVARASKALSIVKGTPYVTFDFNAVSFDLDLDGDGINDAESLPL